MPSESKNNVGISPVAGHPAPKEMLVDVARIEREYFEREFGSECRDRFWAIQE